jgi:hypothetical protein
MTNLTITVDEEILKRARMRALEQGTTVNAILAEHLARFARIRDVQEEAVRNLLAIAHSSSKEDKQRARRRGGRTWKREDLYER